MESRGMNVTELQEVLKVSKKAIYDKLNKDEFKDFVVKVKGVKYITPDGIEILKEAFGKSSKTEFFKEFEDIKKEVGLLAKDINNTADYKDDLIKELKNTINFLKDENNKLFNMIEEQHKIIKKQNDIVQNEQQITLNHTELLLVEKREVLKLRQEQFAKENKGFRKIFKIFR